MPVKLNLASGGSVTLTAADSASNTTVTLPNTTTALAPATSGSSILSGNGAGGFSNVTVGSGLSFSAGTLSSTATGNTQVGQQTGTGTTVSFTGIPSWAKTIIISVQCVTNNNGYGGLVVGSGSYTTSGYTGNTAIVGGSGSSWSGCAFVAASSAGGNSIVMLAKITGNTWEISVTGATSGGSTQVGAGYISLAGTLDSIQLLQVASGPGTAYFAFTSCNAIITYYG